MIEKEKNWFNRNFKKIIFALALTGAITGFTGLIVGSVGVNKTQGLSYYLNRSHEAVWGEGIIWMRNNKYGFELYFAKEKKDISHVKWDGKYPKGYFDDEK